jgi:hypothetical protein
VDRKKPLEPDPEKVKAWLEKSRQELKKSPLKRANKKRREALFKRSFLSKERVKWVRAQPSVVSGRTPCIGHHVKSRGAGGTYRDIVPLTQDEHLEIHNRGRLTCEEKWGVDLEQAAINTQEAWEKATRRTH